MVDGANSTVMTVATIFKSRLLEMPAARENKTKQTKQKQKQKQKHNNKNKNKKNN